MKKSLILIGAIMLMVFSLNAQVNAYLTNMVNGAEQMTIDVSTTSDDLPFVTFTVENGETEAVIIQSVSFACWNFNLTAPTPNIQFRMYANDGTWYPTDNSIFNLNFQNVNTVIQPGTSKTFVVMGNIWENSDGGAKFCLGLCGSGYFQVTGQNTGDAYFVNMDERYQDNIFHIINKWQPMHKLSMCPFVNPVEIYQNYYQDHFWTYLGQTFWSCLTLNSIPNSVENSVVTLSSHTYFGGTPGQINPGDGSFFVSDYLPDLVYAWHPEYGTFQMDWFSPDVTGVDASFLYETLIRTNIQQNQSEYTSINIGNYDPLFGMISENASYERVYHPYQAIKFDVNGDSLSNQADIDMIQQYHVGNLNLYGTNFNNNSGPNISRTSIIFPNPDNHFDEWIGDIFIHHQDNLPSIVQNLGIGQPYDGTWPSVPANFTRTGDMITVDTDDNCIGVFGKLNGEDWNTVIFLNNGEKLRWSSENRSINPEHLQNNRIDQEQIQIQIPVGLIYPEVLTLTLAEYSTTENNDSTIPTPITPILNQNYPNPFNPETTISFDLQKSAEVSLQIYNVKGQLVRTLVNNEVKTSGSNHVTWNGTDDNGNHVSSGVYFYKMKSGSYSATRKMILMK